MNFSVSSLFFPSHGSKLRSNEASVVCCLNTNYEHVESNFDAKDDIQPFPAYLNESAIRNSAFKSVFLWALLGSTDFTDSSCRAQLS